MNTLLKVFENEYHTIQMELKTTSHFWYWHRILYCTSGIDRTIRQSEEECKSDGIKQEYSAAVFKRVSVGTEEGYHADGIEEEFHAGGIKEEHHSSCMEE